jgi:hypothetical protein
MSTEISTVQPRGLALDTFEDAFRFSKLVATSDFAPKDFRGKPESCLLAIQHGAELGPVANAVAACDCRGQRRPSVYGDTAAAVCMASAICEYIRETISGEGEQMVATCIAKRRGNAEPTTVSFSVADAKKAGLWGKQGPWTQYPRRMLQMRARGFALRDAFPDVLRGLVTAEEAADYTHVETEPVRVTQPTPPVADDAAMQKARSAIDLAKDAEQVRKFAAVVRQRVDDGFYAEDQAAELFELLDERMSVMEEVPA